ncbi:MAG: CidA/LrgA family protein [Anaerolineales bacterium]|nr:CidA/LrgA family protein [Anaerolineales bacterium]
MIKALTILLIFQLVGEVISRAWQLPVPGPVLGMLFLFMGLLVRGSTPPELKETASVILQHLTLLFVPAGVGVMVHFALLQKEWLPLLITLVGSTALAIVITALSMRLLRRFIRS